MENSKEELSRLYDFILKRDGISVTSVYEKNDRVILYGQNTVMNLSKKEFDFKMDEMKLLISKKP